MRDATTRRMDAESDRGQTTIDFGIGVAIFLLTIVFIFVFIPSLFQPFVTAQSQAITADRIADSMVESAFIADDRDAERYILDEGCTAAYFELANDGEVDNPEDYNCRWDPGDSGVTAHNVLGLDDSATDFRVTVEPLTDDGSTDPYHTVGGQELAHETETPPLRGTVVTASRIVYFPGDEDTDGEAFRLYVQVW